MRLSASLPGPVGRARLARRGGLTLVELMIAVALIAIGILAMVQSFGFIQKGIQASKNRTLASNLAQEKMQIIKQKSYYQVLVTTDPAHDTGSFPGESVDYDTGYFPPEYITEAGVTYTRYTYVQVAREDSGSIVTLAPNIPDTGLRQITITVAWSQGGSMRKFSLRSLLANPDAVMSNVALNGRVRNASTLAGIGGALVNVAENMGWRDTADASGNYNLNISPGNYTLLASADGYYTQVRNISVAAGTTSAQGFDLVKIATGTVSGSVWLRNHLVISQVVSATVTAGGEIEYVELYNPTTYTITICDPTTGENVVKLRYFGAPSLGNDQDPLAFSCGMLSKTVESGKYFLISNGIPVAVGGASPNPSGLYAASNASVSGGHCSAAVPLDCIRNGYSGVVQIYDAYGVIDTVGWSNNAVSKTPVVFEGAYKSLGDGLEGGDQLVRYTSPGVVTAGTGRAYDSGNNEADFRYGAISQPPYSLYSWDTAYPPVTGTPAVGALITASDGVSNSTTAWLDANGVSTFTLVNVATGTWTVMITSGAYGLQNDTVSVPTAGFLYTFPSSTTALTSLATTALITGRIISAQGNAISPGILVSPGGAGSPTTTNTSSGRYALRVAPGIVDITANPATGGTASYVTMSSNSIQVAAGEVHSGVDFVLYQGGRISGFITRDGINPLPGVVVSVTDINNVSRDQQVSGSDGRFTTLNISTGVYTVTPSLGSQEMSTPSTHTVTLVTQGATVFSTTFTISGAMGYISGAVSSGGQPIKTGVLIVVTTSTLAGSPPAPPTLSTATLTGSPYYIVSSREDGTYLAEVRNSTSPKYNVYAYYPSPYSTAVTMVSSAAANVSVTAGQTTTGVNFSW